MGVVVASDDVFRKQVSKMLSSSLSSVRIVDERALSDGIAADIAVVDIRAEQSGTTRLERLRAVAPNAGILVVASAADPEVILEAMRAGANEFLVWPLQDDKFQVAVKRIASKREAASGRPPGTKLVFVGAKGGVGTTTMAVNCGVELARLSKRPTAIVDLKPGVGEVALFLGVRPRYSVLDAIENIQRLDREFLQGIVVKHKSGLDILAGSEDFDRPGVADGPAIEELLRVMMRQYAYLVVDAGSHISQASLAALFSADQAYLVANPDVPSVRNAQRLLERARRSGLKDDQMRLLLNRTAKSYPIRPKQIESAVGLPIHHSFPSDYQTVSAALNSGVPVSLSGDSPIATQFDLFTRRVLDPTIPGGAETSGRKSLLSVERFTGIW
ncbi:MAG: CpaE family protein [Vicinamibacterales bacterium]